MQKITEEIVLNTARHLRSTTGEKNIVMAGGVALNCVANGKLVAQGIFDKVWIQPAAGDAGGSLGAALLANHVYFDEPRTVDPTGRDAQKGSYLGPRYSSEEVSAFLNRRSLPHERIKDRATRLNIVACAMAHGKIVGWFSGRMCVASRSYAVHRMHTDVSCAPRWTCLCLKTSSCGARINHPWKITRTGGRPMSL